MDILTIFCQVDDFCQVFEPKLNEQMLADGKRKRIKPSKMSRSEVMTILIAFHRSGFRNLKTFYKSLIGVYYKHDFPDLVSYNRFVAPSARCANFARSVYAGEIGKVFRDFIYRFDQDRGVQQLTDQAEQGV